MPLEWQTQRFPACQSLIKIRFLRGYIFIPLASWLQQKCGHFLACSVEKILKVPPSPEWAPGNVDYELEFQQLEVEMYLFRRTDPPLISGQKRDDVRIEQYSTITGSQFLRFDLICSKLTGSMQHRTSMVSRGHKPNHWTTPASIRDGQLKETEMKCIVRVQVQNSLAVQEEEGGKDESGESLMGRWWWSIKCQRYRGLAIIGKWHESTDFGGGFVFLNSTFGLRSRARSQGGWLSRLEMRWGLALLLGKYCWRWAPFSDPPVSRVDAGGDFGRFVLSDWLYEFEGLCSVRDPTKRSAGSDCVCPVRLHLEGGEHTLGILLEMLLEISGESFWSSRER